MENTGFYGETERFEEQDMAVGYGESRVGEKNIPTNWGPTSWLIMGSGGMVSTLDDMYAWLKGMYAGELLSPDAMKVFGKEARGGGISDRGFLVTFTHNADATVIYMTNVHRDEGDVPMALGSAVLRMALENLE